MPTLPLSKARAGMVLAADAESLDGNYRLEAGLELSDGHLRLLRGWHVAAIDVKNDDASPPAPSRDAPEAAILERFAHLPADEPVVAALRRLALDRAATLPPPPPCPIPSAKAATPAALAPERILANDPVLVSLPEVFMRIREVLSDPDSTVEEAAAVIGKDPSLTAKLLKLVNSAFYARTMRVSGGLPPGAVDSLSRAVMLLGLNQLSTLAMGVSVLPLFKDIPPECIDMRQFWRHSVAVGLVAKLLASRLGDPSPERFFVAGLLHDIGRLVLYKQQPAASAAALARAAATGRLLVDVEREMFGFDHGKLGGMLLRKWRFPESLEQAVWRHHDPLGGEVPLEPALICVADMIAGATLSGGSGERLTPRFLPEVWRIAAISPGELPELVVMAESHLDVVCAMFA
ncbi:HDOD domain-containing protein [Solidesulfovibrio sp.]|uniref:HDOD domain-containing protein n=1 Tax=Solidesulfovibrio sp. TaxID=2910990 RepID=UPI0026319578|nr:HDOD domain-containing protein [Solidesulfovibrio sp.]